MNVITIKPSKRKDKKLQAVFPDGSKIDFGAKGYSDYTLHKDPERKQRYLQRHKHDPTNIHSAGALARDILWSEPSLPKAIKYAEKKHGVRIKLAK